MTQQDLFSVGTIQLDGANYGKYLATLRSLKPDWKPNESFQSWLVENILDPCDRLKVSAVYFTMDLYTDLVVKGARRLIVKVTRGPQLGDVSWDIQYEEGDPNDGEGSRLQLARLLARTDALFLRMCQPELPPFGFCHCGHSLLKTLFCGVCNREPEICPCEYGQGPPLDAIPHLDEAI